MALSSMVKAGSAALLALNASAEYLQFDVYDSNDRPTEFKDGLMTYLKVTRDYNGGSAVELEHFLLCNTCTMSYIFGVLDDFETVKETDMMRFK